MENSKKILLCDDDGDIRTLMQIIIQSFPEAEFITVPKINDIIQLCMEVKPTLVLMDLWIPNIGGEKAVLDMKAHHATKNIPVIFFSASDNLEDLCKSTGADGFVNKPFDVMEFKGLLKNYI